MLRGADVKEIVELRRAGLSITKIKALTGFTRRTIRKYLADPKAPTWGPRAPRPSVLEPYKPYIDERLKAGVWNAAVLLGELQQRGFAGGYSTLRAYLHPLRQAGEQVAVRRFETPPGHQAQVDWGKVGELVIQGPHGPERKPLWAFVFTLGHSRAMFADIAPDQQLLSFLRMHEAAFETLGGVPQEILYDWTKTAALGVTANGDIKWHPVFLDFARWWGFVPRMCRPYRAQTKGKVESGVGYIKKNFLCGRTADSADDLRAQLRVWLWDVANRRLHGTTHQVVVEAWQMERPHLQTLDGRIAFPYVPEETRRVARDAYVTYHTNRYSVPWTAAGRQVSLREGDGRLQVWLGEERIAEHALSSGRYQVLTQPGHHADIPLSPSSSSGGTSGSGGPGRHKPSVRIVAPCAAPVASARPAAVPDAPTVQTRSLGVYEALAQAVGGDKSSSLSISSGTGGQQP